MLKIKSRFDNKEEKTNKLAKKEPLKGLFYGL